MGNKIAAVLHTPKPVLTLAIQKIPMVAKAVVVPEIIIDFKLFPKATEQSQNINTKTADNKVSQIPQIKHYSLPLRQLVFCLQRIFPSTGR